MEKSDKDKYLVFCVAKNEDKYIKEFVDHHLSIGFDKIVICDNNDDVTILQKILGDYISCGKVQIFDFSGFEKFQTEAYSMFAKQGNFKWCGFFDCDEFMELNERYSDVKEFLDEVEGECVLLNWMMYGSCGESFYREGKISERFNTPILPLTLNENMFVKSLVKGGLKDVYFKNQHVAVLLHDYRYNDGGIGIINKNNMEHEQIYPPKFQKAYLKHYYTKSIEEFNKKVDRKWPDTSDVTTRNNTLVGTLYYPKYRQLPIEMNGGLLFGRHAERIDTLKYYDVFVYNNVIGHYYSFTNYICDAMSHTTGYTYVVPENIDENIYMMVLGYALETQNRLITVPKDSGSNLYGSITKKFGKINNKVYYIWSF